MVKKANNFRNKQYREVSVVHTMGVRKGKSRTVSHREAQLETRKNRRGRQR